jgi:hypothetical protein
MEEVSLSEKFRRHMPFLGTHKNATDMNAPLKTPDHFGPAAGL